MIIGCLNWNHGTNSRSCCSGLVILFSKTNNDLRTCVSPRHTSLALATLGVGTLEQSLLPNAAFSKSNMHGVSSQPYPILQISHTALHGRDAGTGPCPQHTSKQQHFPTAITQSESTIRSAKIMRHCHGREYGRVLHLLRQTG